MQLTQFAVDDSPHNRDGLVLHGWDGAQQVIGFISRRVMADWAEPGCYGTRGRRLMHIIDCMLLATLSIESRAFRRLRARSATADMLYAFQRRRAP
jgi:hypothetical protein